MMNKLASRERTFFLLVFVAEDRLNPFQCQANLRVSRNKCTLCLVQWVLKPAAALLLWCEYCFLCVSFLKRPRTRRRVSLTLVGGMSRWGLAGSFVIQTQINICQFGEHLYSITMGVIVSDGLIFFKWVDFFTSSLRIYMIDLTSLEES